MHVRAHTHMHTHTHIHTRAHTHTHTTLTHAHSHTHTHTRTHTTAGGLHVQLMPLDSSPSWQWVHTLNDSGHIALELKEPGCFL